MRPIDFYPLRPGANSEDSVFSGVPNGYKQDLIDNVTTAQAISACLLAFGDSEPDFNGENSGKAPLCTPVYMVRFTNHDTIKQPQAGVAQLVERVALMTAKRSTSRSWVRAPPSAIPIS